MQESNAVCPHCQLVDDRVIEVVGGIEADDTRQERPRPERAGAERGDGRGCCRIDALGELEGAVGLRGIQY